MTDTTCLTAAQRDAAASILSGKIEATAEPLGVLCAQEGLSPEEADNFGETFLAFWKAGMPLTAVGAVDAMVMKGQPQEVRATFVNACIPQAVRDNIEYYALIESVVGASDGDGERTGVVVILL